MKRNLKLGTGNSILELDKTAPGWCSVGKVFGNHSRVLGFWVHNIRATLNGEL